MQLMEMARTSPIAVPADGVEDCQVVPFDVKTFPDAPGATN
jgi:hypothetical protein